MAVNSVKYVIFLRDFPELGIPAGHTGIIKNTYGWSQPVRNRKEMAKYKIYSVEYFDSEYSEIIGKSGRFQTVLVDSGDIKHGRVR